MAGDAAPPAVHAITWDAQVDALVARSPRRAARRAERAPPSCSNASTSRRAARARARRRPPRPPPSRRTRRAPPPPARGRRAPRAPRATRARRRARARPPARARAPARGAGGAGARSEHALRERAAALRRGRRAPRRELGGSSSTRPRCVEPPRSCRPVRRARALARRRRAPAAADGPRGRRRGGYARSLFERLEAAAGRRAAATSARPTAAPRKLMLTVQYRMHRDPRRPRRGSTAASSRTRRACSGARAQRGGSATARRASRRSCSSTSARRPVWVARNAWARRPAARAGALTADAVRASGMKLRPLPPLRRASYPTRCARSTRGAPRARAPQPRDRGRGRRRARGSRGGSPPRKHARRAALALPHCAIISPHWPQREMLSACLRDAGLTVNERADRDERAEARARGARGSRRDKRRPNRRRRAGPAGREVEVSTVDGFQGREADVVFVSTVRSSASGGITSSRTRGANVALTRGRAVVAVVGDAATLARDSADWAAFVAHTDAKGRRVRVPPGGAFADALRAGFCAPRLDGGSQRPRPDSGPAAMGANSAMAAPVAACPAKEDRAPTNGSKRAFDQPASHGSSNGGASRASQPTAQRSSGIPKKARK